jgi:hypothetical protein
MAGDMRPASDTDYIEALEGHVELLRGQLVQAQKTEAERDRLRVECDALRAVLRLDDYPGGKMTEPLPCPFCGGPAVSRTFSSGKLYLISCAITDCSGSYFWATETDWNKRAPHPAEKKLRRLQDLLWNIWHDEKLDLPGLFERYHVTPDDLALSKDMSREDRLDMLIKSWADGQYTMGRWNGSGGIWKGVDLAKLYSTFQTKFSREEIAASLERISTPHEREGRTYIVIKATPMGYTETLFRDWRQELSATESGPGKENECPIDPDNYQEEY